MSLMLEPGHLAAIRRHGESDYPAEACGLMGGATRVDGASVARLVPLVNTRTDSAHNRYLIDPAEFLAAQKQLDQAGLDVVGIYHSHPDHPAIPSAFDREHAWPRWSYVIVAVVGGRAADVKSWRLADDRSAFNEEPITLEERKVAWQSPS